MPTSATCRSVRVEPRASGSSAGTIVSNSLGAKKWRVPHADQQSRDSDYANCLVGVPGNSWCGGHGFIVRLTQGSAVRRSADHHGRNCMKPLMHRRQARGRSEVASEPVIVAR